MLGGCHPAILRERAGVPRPRGLREDMRVTVDGARRWHAERAWLARSASPGGLARDVLIEASGERFGAVDPAMPAARSPPGRSGCPGSRCPAWRTPTRTRSTGRCAAGAGRGRHVLGLARGNVHRRRPPGSRHLLRARARRLRRDGAGRDHVRGRVPLPPPQPRRHSGTPTRTRSACASSRRRCGGAADHLARRLLSGRRVRAWRRRAPADRRATAVRRRQTRRLGGAGRRVRLRRPRHARRARADRRGDPLGARGAARIRCPRSWRGRTAMARRCTCTCPSSPWRTPRCRAAFGETPAEVLVRGGRRLARGPRWCTPRT